MRVLSILGSTGSIGTQTLEVVRRHPEDFKVVGLACGSDIDQLMKQIEEFRPEAVSVANPAKAEELRTRLAASGDKTEVLTGEEGDIAIATLSSCDTVVGAMVGVAGLLPTYKAIMTGKDIALANKETLVSGGDVIMPLVKEKGVELLPVDSEHCAIWQCLRGEKQENLDRILITASGGPFRGMKREDLTEMTAENALQHPTWKMGGKITIDSSTMMNKGLEIIEAHHLFGVSVDKIDVVVHPQSVIHSMVRFCDGSVMAQMGKPSMILPIMVALYYPERGPRIIEEFDPFAKGLCNLTFEKCDTGVFGLVDLAYEAGRKGGILPAVMNAANEVAVNAFLEGKIGFLDIEKTVKAVYDDYSGVASADSLTIEDVLSYDREARIKGGEYISKWTA